MAQPTKSVVHSKRTLFDDFFKIDEVRVSHELFPDRDGKERGMSPEQRLLVFERGDAVAALLYDPDRREVILVNQFRAPTLGKGDGQGWIIETAAGMHDDPRETVEECLRREIIEETGYVITEAKPVATFFSSPGGTSERILLYFAEVRYPDAKEKGGGNIAEGEDIQLAKYPIQDFFRRLDNRQFEDPKVIIAGQWLRQRESRALAEKDQEHSRTFKWRFRDDPSKIVGIKTGNILATKGIDVWVNSENTDMMMDRFFGRSLSATIRAHGAKKVAGTNPPRIEADTIGEALREAMRDRNFVELATVLVTTSGELAKTHKVKRIFHVASVEGNIGQGLTTSVKTIERCVDNVLDEVERANGRLRAKLGPLRHVLFPMVATGQGGFLVDEVGPAMVERAVAFLGANKRAKLNEIYFLAFSLGDLDILERAMRDQRALEPVAGESPV